MSQSEEIQEKGQQQDNQETTQNDESQKQVAETNTQFEDAEQIEKDREKCLELKNKASEFFAKQNFDEAADLYNEAIDYCPLEDKKMLCILNSNISICLMKQFDYELAIEHCSKALEFDSEFIKALLNRAECYEKTEKFEEALEDYKKLKQLQPDNKQILKKYIDLDQKVQEIQEKQKKEALNGLKDLGNTLLGKIGLSLDNFKVQQNENGSYNIQFQQ